VAVCHAGELVDQPLRMPPYSASMVTSAGEVGKCHFALGRHYSASAGSGVLHLASRERGVTAVGTTGSPTIRRRELGTLLRKLRTEKNWTADQVSERLQISPSKLSRLETGHRGASARDIRRLCDLYDVDDAQRQRLLDLASEGKERAWWQFGGVSYPTYVGMEAEAATIKDYGLGFIPGLLQTHDYATETVRAAPTDWSPEVVEQRVEWRMNRQRLLFSDQPPTFEAVVDESVLHRLVGGPDVMRAQLERLLELSRLPHVSVRVIPYDAGALPAGNNKFIILGFAQPDVPDVVFIEGLTGDLYLDDPSEVGIYTRTFRTLTRLAASPEATREIISSMINSQHVQTG
jgi:transcriptional regulator with XRE-family HTH domain